MTVRNPTKDAHPSNLTPDQFGRAMSRLDLSGVAPENRHRAVMDHLRRVMIGSIVDGSVVWDLAQSAITKGRR